LLFLLPQIQKPPRF